MEYALSAFALVQFDAAGWFALRARNNRVQLIEQLTDRRPGAPPEWPAGKALAGF